METGLLVVVVERLEVEQFVLSKNKYEKPARNIISSSNIYFQCATHYVWWAE